MSDRAAAEPACGVAASEGPPIFVTSGARSGSTLLRFLIDAHPDVACPPESEIASLVAAWVNSAEHLRLPRDGSDGYLASARRAAEALMTASAAVGSKPRWCDKSLTNVEHLETLASVWPDARFLLLHRASMDFVASALEAQPWGFYQYGLGEFLQAGQTNTVLSLVNYWMDRAVRMQNFAEAHPKDCLVIRYEDLVSNTDAEMRRVWDFVGVASLERTAGEAFARRPSARGAADYKIWFTDGVHADSVGRGGRVPAEMVREPFRGMMNGLLAKLGYPPVDARWGSAGDVAAGTVPASSLGLLEVRLVDGHSLRWSGRVDLETDLVSADETDQQLLPVVVAELDALRGILAATIEIASALRARTVRAYGISFSGFAEERRLYDTLLGVLAGQVLPEGRSRSGGLSTGLPGTSTPRRS